MSTKLKDVSEIGKKDLLELEAIHSEVTVAIAGVKNAKEALAIAVDLLTRKCQEVVVVPEGLVPLFFPGTGILSVRQEMLDDISGSLH